MLSFTPEEFQVLEDLEFDETIQRPEKIRFFTLDEQETDAYERLVPKGRVTQFQREQVKTQVGRLRDLYETYVVPTEATYTLREPEYARSFSWIHPVYATPDWKAYNWKTQWSPLFDNLRAPNAYPRMIAALPRPFADTAEGIPYTPTDRTELVNADGQKPRVALPDYVRTRAQIHEDKTVTLLPVPIAGSGDAPKFVGYYLEKRALAVPNPLPDHPFLKGSDATFLESTASLRDIVPSLDAILTHAVPVTRDPYKEAEPYLRVYDVKLGDIPWSTWKSKFPQAESVEIRPDPEVIPFPSSSQAAPSEKVQELYGSTYAPGLSPREWLMRQDDGGEIVIRALKTKVLDHGSVEVLPGADLPSLSYPETTLQECDLMGIPFPEFLVRGLLRRTWTSEGIRFVCVPLEFAKQERARAGYVRRLPWRETTPSEILDSFLRALRGYRRLGDAEAKFSAEAKTPVRPESAKRADVRALLDDPQRLPEDKARDILEMIREDTTLTQHVYSDAEGAFVVCEHTLEVLHGAKAKDPRVFYDQWTARVDGFRVCKYCGQRMDTEELVHQEDFTEDGFAVRHAESFEVETFHSEAIQGYTTGLQALRTLFDLDQPADAVLYLIISLLQVLPDAEQLTPILQIARALSARLGKDPKRNATKGAIGIVAAIVLLQSHKPLLLPRRSFGPKPIKISGWPRDLAAPEEYSIVDSLMGVLRKTFEAYPTTLKGSFVETIRAILNNPSAVKKNVVTLVNEVLKTPDIRTRLQEAKAIVLPETTPPEPLLPSVLPPKEMGVLQSYPSCELRSSVLPGLQPPRYVQPEVPLRRGLVSSPNALLVQKPSSARETVRVVPKPEIQRRMKLKPTKLALRDPYRTNLAIASRLADLRTAPLPVRAVDPTQKPDELRDVARGLVYEATQDMDVDSLRTQDVALYCLMSDYKEERTQANKLRATERLKFVEEMSKRTDLEREIIKELLGKGLAPIIITSQDRELFAREAEALQTLTRQAEEEIGVGLPQDYADQGDVVSNAGVDNGNYGDYTAQPSNDGRDAVVPTLTDDAETSI